MEHLACYLPGTLALGVAEGAVGGEKALAVCSGDIFASNINCDIKSNIKSNISY